MSQDPDTGDSVNVTVTSQDLQDLGLIPPSSGDAATDTVAMAGQAGDKTEVVTNYRAVSANEANAWRPASSSATSTPSSPPKGR